jgi:hypothetical protein
LAETDGAPEGYVDFLKKLRELTIAFQNRVAVPSP